MLQGGDINLYLKHDLDEIQKRVSADKRHPRVPSQIKIAEGRGKTQQRDREGEANGEEKPPAVSPGSHERVANRSNEAET